MTVKSSYVVIAAALGSLAASGCARPQTQVLTPVRLDTSSVHPMVVSAPLVTTMTGAPRTATADPFFTTNRMDWPGPNAFRSSSGAPGTDYWQQRADYNIAVTLDTAQQQVEGTVTIRYTNNSPDSLRSLWLQLDQNLYRPNSWGSALFPADSRWGVRGFQGGYNLSEVLVNGRAVPSVVSDTRARLDLDTPVPPKGGKATIVMRYNFKVPEHGSDRMGHDGSHYFIAQWYPRMAVYDDVRGWNTDPYLGQGEFYLEYGDIDYAITAPAGYVIAGSGLLQNPADVLTSAQRTRLAQAAKSAATVQVIPLAEAVATPTPGTKTWKFRAENVRDVAWAGAPNYRWDAASWNGILTQAYYVPGKAGKTWEHAAQYTRFTLSTYSRLFYPFPYPQATSVATTVGGMEYPMFVMNGYNVSEDTTAVYGVNDHEHGHEWYPMLVGSNERRYAWMDEGFNTYINTFSNERFEPNRPVWSGYMANWKQVRDAGIESPLMTQPDHVASAALGAIGYRKPGAVLLTLRNHVVGAETFDRAFREYTRRWAFKHPTPGDFFRTVENVSGMDLSWYWKSFFYSTDVLDIGIDSVSSKTVEGETQATVALRRNTSVVFPVELRLKLADGSTTDVKLPVDIWAQDGNTGHFSAVFTVRSKVVGARLWPDPSVPDWNAQNDAWGDAPAANPLGPVTGGGLTTVLGAPLGSGKAAP